MIDRRTVFEIHRLFHEGYGIRKIARTLKLSRDSVKRYLDQPNPPKPVIVRASKLDPFREEIQRLLEKDPTVSSSVLFQRLIPQGYTGKTSILRDYLHEIRPKEKRAYLRFESAPGKQFQVDWGHFGSLLYGKTPRKLYCLAIIEAHSRLLYGEFTHSQKQEALHQALLNAFLFFGGVCSELVVDNMGTAVTEREGALIRFNEAFLEFLRPFRIVPRACHPHQPQEKGKIEKGGIHYIRHNFWPLRSFTDLTDVNQQFRHWLETQANIRIHSTTGERPKDRFKPEALQRYRIFYPTAGKPSRSRSRPTSPFASTATATRFLPGPSANRSSSRPMPKPSPSISGKRSWPPIPAAGRKNNGSNSRPTAKPLGNADPRNGWQSRSPVSSPSVRKPRPSWRA